MTEKRFTSQRTHDYNYSDILDNGKWVGICHVDCEDDFVDKLNGLAEENQDLHKKEVELGQNYLRLLEENEQLKKENYELHKRLGDFEPFERYMKKRTSKTSLEDIIGIVKTDEPTNSVELKKELYK